MHAGPHAIAAGRLRLVHRRVGGGEQRLEGFDVVVQVRNDD